jgi:hypothetical protein
MQNRAEPMAPPGSGSLSASQLRAAIATFTPSTQCLNSSV